MTYQVSTPRYEIGYRSQCSTCRLLKTNNDVVFSANKTLTITCTTIFLYICMYRLRNRYPSYNNSIPSTKYPLCSFTSGFVGDSDVGKNRDALEREAQHEK